MHWTNFVIAIVAFFLCPIAIAMGDTAPCNYIDIPLGRHEDNEPFGLDELILEFSKVEEIHLKQSWLPAPEPGFSPTRVKVMWKPAGLAIFAQLQDNDIVSKSTHFNQRLWELGDVFESFIYFKEADAYYEFHVSSNNHVLQLRFDMDLTPDQRRLQLPDLLITEQIIESNVWLREAGDQWYVLLKIPASVLKPSGFFAAGDTLGFSFSRYDHSRDNETPVLSSSSDHRELDFHSREDWGTLRLKGNNDL